VREKRILGCSYGSARPDRDIPMLVDLYRDGRLRPEVALAQTIGLDEVEQAIEGAEEAPIVQASVLLQPGRVGDDASGAVRRLRLSHVIGGKM
jgi:Zn-dependent alcohol dehydrogenase